MGLQPHCRGGAEAPRGLKPALQLVCALFAICLAAQGAGIESLHNSFVNPPANARIMVRWWWFGPAVTDDELARELREMKAAGIGGVEIQTVYPLNLDDPAKHFRNLPYLSADYLHALHFAFVTAKQLGLRVDLTLASGWPYGGAQVPVNEAAGRLRVVHATVPDGARSLAVPAMENPFFGIAPVLPDTPFPASGIGFLDLTWKNSYPSQWNFEIQRQVTKSSTFSLAYVGSRSLTA